MKLVSIIIPCLNEEKNLSQFLPNIQSKSKNLELIVVDGGSEDNLLTIAREYADLVIEGPKGRALQQNAGGKAAKGDVFWFLHADSKLDYANLDKYLNAISKNEWGRFAVKLSDKSLIFRMIEWFMNKRSCLSSIATGDQGIFIKRELFEEIDGFPEQKLMEDVEICKRLKRIAPMSCINHLTIETSSRKWEEEGIWRTIFLMWKLRFLYFIGVSPERLVKQYYK